MFTGMTKKMSMKKILFLITVLFSLNSFAQKTKIYKEYSYSEFIKLLTEEKDTLFELSYAMIKYDSITDAHFKVKLDSLGNELKFSSKHKEITLHDTIIINKHVHLRNVFFSNNVYLKDFNFKKSVTLTNCILNLSNNSFEGEFEVFYNKDDDTNVESISRGFRYSISIINNIIKEDFKFGSLEVSENKNLFADISNNIFTNPLNKSNTLVNLDQSMFVLFRANRFLGNGRMRFFSLNTKYKVIRNNEFGNIETDFELAQSEPYIDIEFLQNTFNLPVSLDIKHLQQEDFVGWQQFKNGVYNEANYTFYLDEYYGFQERGNQTSRDEKFDKYFNEHIYTSKTAFDRRTKFLGKYYNFFRSQHATDKANSLYITIKDLETKRLKYRYEKNPTFTTFFKWRINQFLKLFSDYGTEPSKAIVVSLYVILLFAFIYLLFPNSWDSHGRKRIMNRYAFFFKYMNKKAGIHEVYLDNQKEDLLEFDEFKKLVEQQGKTVPKFFTATALPLYKWAISSTKFSASVLKRVDIMKGTWSEVPKSKRIWKSILLIGAFTLAICYDILIKMLNAIMLSINTFTTLGFGEIPIKGLPRYLAIIQGFIGWFMLTIFSVSLISQLLN